MACQKVFFYEKVHLQNSVNKENILFFSFGFEMLFFVEINYSANNFT